MEEFFIFKSELEVLDLKDLEMINGGFWPLAYALIYASIAIPFYAGWKAYE